jgi:hypothetical protein
VLGVGRNSIVSVGGSVIFVDNGIIVNSGRCTLSKKLDRGLANVSCRRAFPEAFVGVLCRLDSYHNHMFVRFGGLPLAKGPRPFCFEAAWIYHDDYSVLVFELGIRRITILLPP